MTAEEIKSLVRHSETSVIEFKLGVGGVPANLWESYSSFANTDGGVIVLGVREEKGVREIVGLPDVDKCTTEIWNVVNNTERVSANILTNRMVYPVDVDGRKLVVIEVPRAERSDRPVYVGADVFKGTFRRNGEGDYKCNRESVLAMIRDQCVETADQCVIDEMRVEDLNQDTIRRYRMRFDELRPNHVWSALPNDEFLLTLGAARRGHHGDIHPTLAGLVTFGNFSDIGNVLPNFFLDYREHADPKVRWTDRISSGDATWSGNIYDFFMRVHPHLTEDIKVPFRIGADNVSREDDTDVHDSVREVLANALIHADYHGRRGIVVDKYPNGFTISNPGNMRVRKSVAIAGGASDARNAKIFNTFAAVKIGERSGMGLSQLYGVWKRVGFDAPVLTEGYDPERTSIAVVIKAGASTQELTEKLTVNAVELTENPVQLTEKLTVNAGELTEKPVRLTEKLTETEERILTLLRENPHTTQAMLSDKLGITRPYIGKIMGDLQSRGIIKRIGPDKGGVWEVRRVEGLKG